MLATKAPTKSVTAILMCDAEMPGADSCGVAFRLCGQTFVRVGWVSCKP